jgi:hypothetical protein
MGTELRKLRKSAMPLRGVVPGESGFWGFQSCASCGSPRFCIEKHLRERLTRKFCNLRNSSARKRRFVASFLVVTGVAVPESCATLGGVPLVGLCVLVNCGEPSVNQSCEPLCHCYY